MGNMLENNIKRNSHRSIAIGTFIVLVLVFVGLYTYKNVFTSKERDDSVITSVTPTPFEWFQDIQINMIDDQLTEFVNSTGKYSYKYTNNYEPVNQVVGSELKLNNISEYDYGRGGNIVVGYDGKQQDNAAVFKRTITTVEKYIATQYVYVNSPDHPQGLGTIRTIIKSNDRVVDIYTFIGGYLEDAQKSKSLKNLTKDDYLKILDSNLKDYEIVVNSFKFI